MDIFKQRQTFYEAAVKEAKIVGCASSDHTFKVSKNVGMFRVEDDVFVNFGNKLFLILGGDQRIVGWKLTQTLSHDEIEETLKEVSLYWTCRILCNHMMSTCQDCQDCCQDI